MANTTIVPKHIAEAIVSPRAHAEPIERAALLSGLRYLRANNPVGLVEAHGFDPFWLISQHRDVFEVSRKNNHFAYADRPSIVCNREAELAMSPKSFSGALSWPLDVLLRFSVVAGISDGRCLTVRVQLIAQAHRPQLGLLLICPDQELSMTWPLARSEGFEPPALGIEIRCSIQLSYERIGLFDAWAGGLGATTASRRLGSCWHLAANFSIPRARAAAERRLQEAAFAALPACFLTGFLTGFLGSGCSAACFMERR